MEDVYALKQGASVRFVTERKRRVHSTVCRGTSRFNHLANWYAVIV